MTHTYSRPIGMSVNERAATRKRLAGAIVPNASGATGMLPSSDASLARQLPPMELTEEQKAAAEHNRKNRETARELEKAAKDMEAGTASPSAAGKAAADALRRRPYPVNGEDTRDALLD